MDRWQVFRYRDHHFFVGLHLLCISSWFPPSIPYNSHIDYWISMPILTALAMTFQVTEFDILVFWFMWIGIIALYYLVTLHRIFEAVFGAIVWMGIYILLVVLLVWDQQLGTDGTLFPFWFSVFLVSIAVYLVYILAVLFPLHGGLVISEPTQPTLYTLMYIFVSGYLIFVMVAIVIYMIEQTYIFRVQTLFVWFRDIPYYADIVKKSWFFTFVMSHQNTLIPLGVVLMLYKLLLSNLINAAALSIWYNLSHVWFYRSKNEASYRVEFHEVGASSHDEHGDTHGWHDEHGHDDQGAGHDSHGHGGWHH